ncbi:hypothetical protein [Asticcacaulis sp. YBE204]|uniref:hypothetical protein n=1 Tax=Asticcacaulis sp. YBE204 TaxID=1282363 RepID=UPI0003C3F16D|nr:hypothetical protein [Asticcacaulis sp. YBE204]ESQ77951.1 hypothetical protein AEYBE204_15765 [Asticcacaulis sp. YBE204]
MNTFVTNGPLTDWKDHDAFWRQDFTNRPYGVGQSYEQLEPAYRFGYDLFGRRDGTAFNDIDDAELRAEWDAYPRRGELDWDRARDAVRDAYLRSDIDHPSEFDRVIHDK